jgi:guanylate kinase
MSSKVFVISGQSAVGKGAIGKALREKYPDFYDIITCTTRPPRPNETDGKDYFFLNKEQFLAKIDNQQFLEYAHVHDWYYGTPKSELEKAKNQNKNVFLEIDVQGAVEVKKILPESVLIFISYEEGDLEQLIRNRMAHDPKRRNFSDDEINKRLESARIEDGYKKYYDYVVINPEGHPEKAIEEITNIVTQACRGNF